MDFAQARRDAARARSHLQSERAHDGRAPGPQWRHASDGGWFSFDLKVSPDKPAFLAAPTGAARTEARTFDIMVDGVKIANQSLGNDRPGQFFDVSYAVPEELTRGKEKNHRPLPGASRQLQRAASTDCGR